MRGPEALSSALFLGLLVGTAIPLGAQGVTEVSDIEAREVSKTPVVGERDLAETPGFEVQELTEAPDFELVDTYGDKVRLSDFRGQIVVLHFWAKWCASCKVDLSYFQTAHERYASQGVVVLGLAYASGAREAVTEFIDELGVDFPVVLCDEETRNLYQVAGLPTNYVIDREGKIRYVSRRLMNASYWESVFAELLAEEASAPSE